MLRSDLMGPVRRLAGQAVAVVALACTDVSAPVSRQGSEQLSSCKEQSLINDCPAPPRDSAYVCILSHDVTIGEWWEWCGWVAV